LGAAQSEPAGFQVDLADNRGQRDAPFGISLWWLLGMETKNSLGHDVNEPVLCWTSPPTPPDGALRSLPWEKGSLSVRRELTHAHVGVYNYSTKGVRMGNLQRVNLLLERRQREALEKLARQRNRSVSDLVREYITAGLREDNSQQRERLVSLENARALKARVLKRRKGKPVTKAVKVMERMREERTNELLGRGR